MISSLMSPDDDFNDIQEDLSKDNATGDTRLNDIKSLSMIEIIAKRKKIPERTGGKIPYVAIAMIVVGFIASKKFKVF